MSYYSRCDSPFGTILLVGDEQGLSHLHFETMPTNRPSPLRPEWLHKPDFFREAEAQLRQYFDGRRKEFTIGLHLRGSDFQQRVWRKLLEIPYGTVQTYRDVARTLGLENGARSVGSANARNPVPVIVPCHRIIASGGRLAGYAYGEELKKRLLLVEGVDRWAEESVAASATTSETTSETTSATAPAAIDG